MFDADKALKMQQFSDALAIANQINRILGFMFNTNDLFGFMRDTLVVLVSFSVILFAKCNLLFKENLATFWDRLCTRINENHRSLPKDRDGYGLIFPF
jgi:hypothetical protein